MADLLVLHLLHHKLLLMGSSSGHRLVCRVEKSRVLLLVTSRGLLVHVVGLCLQVDHLLTVGRPAIDLVKTGVLQR
jgi:hypothetical protein